MWDMENDTTFALDEQDDLEREERIWGRDAALSSSPKRDTDPDLHTTLMSIQQTQMEMQSSQLKDLQNRLHEQVQENIALKAGKRKAEEDDEPIALQKKLQFTDDEDDAWHNINKSA